MNAVEEIKKSAIKHGAKFCEIIPAADLDFPEILTDYEKFPYIKNKIKERKNIRNWWDKTKSILICLYPYWDKNRNFEKENAAIKNPAEFLKEKGRIPPASVKNLKIKNFKISRFALSFDYHKTLKKALEKTLEESRKLLPDLDGKIFADTAPVAEKFWAQKAGLGFIGKNTLLINKNCGSYFFIGGIALNLAMNDSKIKAEENLCGNCDKCLKSCPTKALSEDGLNPNKCIAYWTTSKEKEIPPQMLEHEFIYGCDICQEICPYNK